MQLNLYISIVDLLSDQIYTTSSKELTHGLHLDKVQHSGGYVVDSVRVVCCTGRRFRRRPEIQWLVVTCS